MTQQEIQELVLKLNNARSSNGLQLFTDKEVEYLTDCIQTHWNSQNQ